MHTSWKSIVGFKDDMVINAGISRISDLTYSDWKYKCTQMLTCRKQCYIYILITNSCFKIEFYGIS